MKKKFKIATLGCRTNQYESQAYRDQLISLGYLPAKEDEPADICIVNTCSVTCKADGSSKAVIKQMKKYNPHAAFYVTGCMVENHSEELKKEDDQLYLVPNSQKETLVNKIFDKEEQKGFPRFAIKRFEGHTRAFIKVQDGCNSFCSYCIIPFLRGRSRSRTIDDVITEVNDLVAHGYKEVVLTGINLGDYDGGDEKGHLSALVKAVDEVPGIERIRLSSIYADEVDEQLADVILTGKHTCKSMHIVLQSGSDRVLKQMNRKYTQQFYLDKIQSLQAKCPDFTVTTDIIVGFPGETEEDFEDTLRTVEKVRFAKVHVFPYSKREGTRAARFTDHLPKQVIEKRRDILLDLSEKGAFSLRQDFLGREMDILLESKLMQDKTLISGHSDNFLLVHVKGENLHRNSFVKTRIVDNTNQALIAEVV